MFSFIRCNAFILSVAEIIFQGQEISTTGKLHWDKRFMAFLCIHLHRQKDKIKNLDRWTRDAFPVLIFVSVLSLAHSDPHHRAWRRWTGPSDWCHRRLLFCIVCIYKQDDTGACMWTMPVINPNIFSPQLALLCILRWHFFVWDGSTEWVLKIFS